MSALGQKRTLERLHPMSALPPKADIGTGPARRVATSLTRLIIEPREVGEARPAGAGLLGQPLPRLRLCLPPENLRC